MSIAGKSEKVFEALGREDHATARELLQEMGLPGGAESNCFELLQRFEDADRPSAILDAALRSFEPEMCLNNWGRFAKRADRSVLQQVGDHPQGIEWLSQLFSFSQTLSDQLIHSTEWLSLLLEPEALKKDYGQDDYDQPLADFLGELQPESDPRAEILKFKRREMLRIAMRDLLGLATLPTVAAEIAYLAGSIVRFALNFLRLQLEAQYGRPVFEDEYGKQRVGQFAVIAMGKMGGHELNVSSDLDLIFVYDQEGETEGIEDNGKIKKQISNHQFFTLLSERLIRFLIGQGGPFKLYRIDARLRPEGQSGPLARSMQSYENYLLSQARIWEKIALIKARAIAGDRSLGKRFEELARQFVFQSNPVELMLREVLKLKERIDREVVVKGLSEREVKRGYGGIREIEFQVCALQLIHGTQNISIRRRATLHALDLLGQTGIMSRKQYDDLVDAYIWLRTVEHRLQYLREQQQHTIPKKPAELEALARRCGIRPRDDQSAADLFMERHKQVTETVHRWFLDVFGAEQHKAVRDETRTELWTLLHSETDPEKAHRILEKYNFREVSASIKAIRRLAYGTQDRYITAEGQQFFERIFPHLMNECSVQPRPDHALRQFESFLLKSGGITAYYGFMIDYPPVLRLLCRIFGYSNYLSKLLIQHPEYLDLLVATDSSPEADEAHARQLLRSVLSSKAEEVAMNRLRRYYQQEMLKSGQRFLLNLAEPADVSAHLSQAAFALLQSSHQYAMKWSAQKYLPPDQDESQLEFVILGLGKLGERQLGYFSDLDVVYVYDSPPDFSMNPQDFYSQVARKIHELFTHVTAEGKLFPIDARLRPEGKSGPLVVSLERFCTYFESGEAQPWEFQAYLRMSLGAGTESLFHNVRDAFWQSAVRLRDRVELVPTIREMRQKLEDSAQLPMWAERDFKRGPGGYVDIEFLAQFMQLRHGAEAPELKGSGTKEVISTAARQSWIEEMDATHLAESYDWYRKLEMVSRLFFEKSENLVPKGGEKLTDLKTALGLFSLNIEDAPHHASRTREIFDKYLS